MRQRILSVLALGLAVLLTAFSPVRAADDDTLQGFVAVFGSGDFEAMDKAVAGLAATGDPRAVAILDALDQGRIVSRTNDNNSVTVAEDTGKGLVDPVTRTAVEAGDPDSFDKITINNRIRRALDAALGGLRLMSPDPARRYAAAEAVFKSREAAQIPLLDRAIAVEKDPPIKLLMVRARAAAVLGDAAAGTDDRLAAVGVIAALGDQDAIGLLTPLTGGNDAVGAAAKAAVGHIATSLQLWSVAQNIWYGLSLSSVLLLAAIGLAITFGVMGVINMAHGEMVMIGAYTTYVVQQLIRTHAPGLFDVSLLIAIPLAFLVSALVGIVIERMVIRFLYGRALETLLATWGISLILQQLVRSVFGPDNMQVGNPSWMSGAFELGLIQVTWSRLWIIVFAAVVFAGLLVVLKNTFFGLTMRAVTQNRGMASAMGIRTPLVDALTFGLGSGIAGIAGVALSQIDNVSPNLGQGYIIDSFMVVVFGGVGNLWGTLVGAATLGIANKFLEPFAGAVLGKIVLLVLIILFIQKRPRGLFALKGRAIEA